jgi:hypothetical protein
METSVQFKDLMGSMINMGTAQEEDEEEEEDFN